MVVGCKTVDGRQSRVLRRGMVLAVFDEAPTLRELLVSNLQGAAVVIGARTFPVRSYTSQLSAVANSSLFGQPAKAYVKGTAKRLAAFNVGGVFVDGTFKLTLVAGNRAPRHSFRSLVDVVVKLVVNLERGPKRLPRRKGCRRLDVPCLGGLASLL